MMCLPDELFKIGNKQPGKNHTAGSLEVVLVKKQAISKNSRVIVVKIRTSMFFNNGLALIKMSL